MELCFAVMTCGSRKKVFDSDRLLGTDKHLKRDLPQEK